MGFLSLVVGYRIRTLCTVIAVAGSPTAPTSATGVSTTSLRVSGKVPTTSPSLVSSSRTIRTTEDLIAERLAQPLPHFSATNATDFMKWAYLFIYHYKIIPGFMREVFDRPREELSFEHVTDAQVNFLYFVLWERLLPIVSQLTGVQSMLEEIPVFEVHSLWQVLKNEFCPPHKS